MTSCVGLENSGSWEAGGVNGGHNTWEVRLLLGSPAVMRYMGVYLSKG